MQNTVRFYRLSLPIILLGLLIILTAVGLGVFAAADQLSIIGNMIIMIMMFCPIVICSGVLYIALAAAIFYTNKGHQVSRSGLKAGQGLSASARQKVEQVSDNVNRQSIKWGARFAYLDQVFDTQSENGKQNERE